MISSILSLVKGIPKVLKKIRCDHDWKVVKEEILGATMDWRGRPVPYFLWHKVCRKCDAYTTETGVVFGHRKIYPDRYDEDGWPLDRNGNRLEMEDI